jgi:hypothetical protein
VLEINSENLNILADGAGVYVLGIVPEETDNTYHKLKVTLKDPRKLSARACAGYWATESGVAAPAAPEAVKSAPAPLNLSPERASAGRPARAPAWCSCRWSSATRPAKPSPA